MELSVFFAGTAGSVPSAYRGLPATLITAGGYKVLFDCGEGTQRQLQRSVGLVEVDAVFITHFHADHWLGLPGMLKTFDLRGRERPLAVYGPPGIKEMLKPLQTVFGNVSYEQTTSEVVDGEEVDFGAFYVQGFEVDHRGMSLGYSLIERDRPGRFDPELAEKLGAQPGPEFGQLQAGKSVRGIDPNRVVGPDRSGRRVVLTGDTSPCPRVLREASCADLLIHEATFLNEDSERAAKTGHSTAVQAAKVAETAEVELLALNHISTRYDGRDMEREARSVFKNTVVPRDFDTIDIPLPERDGPKLTIWRDRVSAERDR